MLKKRSFTAIVPAAGTSKRMMGQNKLLADLGGKPLIARTLKVISLEPRIEKIILVSNYENFDVFLDILKNYPVEKKIEMVEGGEERQHSVYHGVLRSTSDFVVIHDGARPFLSRDLLARLLDSADDNMGVIPGIPMSDTIKRVSNEKFATETIERRDVYRIQTPQVFRRENLLKAYESAGINERIITDDAGIMEAAGYPIKIIEGSELNFKITTPQDLIIARAMIESGLIERYI